MVSNAGYISQSCLVAMPAGISSNDEDKLGNKITRQHRFTLTETIRRKEF